MTRVRRHARQLASGKTTTVRQHERAVPHLGRDTADDWWDYRDDPRPAGDHPEGTTFFDQDGETMAVHPDGTVHQVIEGDDDDDPGLDFPVPRKSGPRGKWLSDDEIRKSGRCSDGTGAHFCGRPTAPGAPFGSCAGHAEHYWGEVDGTPAPPRSGDQAYPGMAQTMREWRARPEPAARPEPPKTPQMEKLLGLDTPEGRAKYDRLRAYREAGYDGPLDQDGNIPDPDDPANHASLSALAGLSERN